MWVKLNDELATELTDAEVDFIIMFFITTMRMMKINNEKAIAIYDKLNYKEN